MKSIFNPQRSILVKNNWVKLAEGDILKVSGQCIAWREWPETAEDADYEHLMYAAFHNNKPAWLHTIHMKGDNNSVLDHNDEILEQDAGFELIRAGLSKHLFPSMPRYRASRLIPADALRTGYEPNYQLRTIPNAYVGAEYYGKGEYYDGHATYKYQPLVCGDVIYCLRSITSEKEGEPTHILEEIHGKWEDGVEYLYSGIRAYWWNSEL